MFGLDPWGSGETPRGATIMGTADLPMDHIETLDVMEELTDEDENAEL